MRNWHSVVNISVHAQSAGAAGLRLATPRLDPASYGSAIANGVQAMRILLWCAFGILACILAILALPQQSRAGDDTNAANIPDNITWAQHMHHEPSKPATCQRIGPTIEYPEAGCPGSTPRHHPSRIPAAWILRPIEARAAWQRRSEF
jgi:hypothetical protein